MTNFRRIDVTPAPGETHIFASAERVNAELERANVSRHGMHVKLGKHEAELDDMADWADDVNQRLSALETDSMQTPSASLQRQVDNLRAILIQRVEELRSADTQQGQQIDDLKRRIQSLESERSSRTFAASTPALTAAMRKEAARVLHWQAAIEADLGNPGRAEYFRHAADMMETS